MIVNRIGKNFLAQVFAPIPDLSGYLGVLTRLDA